MIPQAAKQWEQRLGLAVNEYQEKNLSGNGLLPLAAMKNLMKEMTVPCILYEELPLDYPERCIDSTSVGVVANHGLVRLLCRMVARHFPLDVNSE